MKKSKIAAAILAALTIMLSIPACTSSQNDTGTDSQKADTPATDIGTTYNSDDDVETGENEIVDSVITSVALKSDKKIYALTNNGNEIELLNTDEYNGGVQYTYLDGKLYLYLYKYTPGKFEDGEMINESEHYNTLGYIDLNDENYTFTKLSDVDAEGWPYSIAAANNSVYFTSSAFGGIYEYDITTKESAVCGDFNFGTTAGIRLYTLADGKLAYSTNGVAEKPSAVGILDTVTGDVKEIYSNAALEYVCNEKIICSVYGDNYSEWTYHEYNTKDSTSKQISDPTSSMVSIYDSYIIPVNDYYLYANKNSIYKYLNGKGEKIYEFDYDIYSINSISDSILNIQYGNPLNGEMTYGSFDLNTSEFKEIQNEASYSQVLYIK